MEHGEKGMTIQEVKLDFNIERQLSKPKGTAP
jgi:hypothetical protein